MFGGGFFWGGEEERGGGTGRWCFRACDSSELRQPDERGKKTANLV